MSGSAQQARGLLSRRNVTPIFDIYIGKESNRLEDATLGLLHQEAEALDTYTDVRREIWERYLRPLLKQIPVRWLMEQTGLGRRTIQRLRNGHSRPRSKHRELITAAVWRWFSQGGL